MTYLFVFLILVLSSKQIGEYLKKIHLPLITGFLIAGIIVGPYVLELITAETVLKLKFVDELALAFIAFAAGSELHLEEMRDRMKAIRCIAVGLVLSTFVLGTLGVIFLSPHIPFLASMGFKAVVGVALLAGSILVARSPSSAIALIRELRAKGPFTKSVMGVTVLIDVVVIILFAVNSTIADVLIAEIPFSFHVIAEVMVDIILAVVAGLVISKIIRAFFHLPLPQWVAAIFLVAIGLSVFEAVDWFAAHSEQNWGFKIELEALLICLTASIAITNDARHREQFSDIIHDTGPVIYLLFFTLTGAALRVDLIPKLFIITILLVMIRLFSLFLGSFIGGFVAGDAMKYNKVAWLSFITQAGVGLGLAKEVHIRFPEWGADFATLLISVIIVNQLIGPILFKWTIKFVGEAHAKAKRSDYQEGRDAIIIGNDDRAYDLYRRLLSHSWEAKLISTENRFDGAIKVEKFDLKTLQANGANQAYMVVTLLDDQANFDICEQCFEHFGTPQLIALNEDSQFTEKFESLGVVAIETNSTMNNLLEHFVRSPAAVSMLLGLFPEEDAIDLEVRDKDLCGLSIHEVRLPHDVVILTVHRDGKRTNIRDNFRFKLGDVVTLVGPFPSLDQATITFDQISS